MPTVYQGGEQETALTSRGSETPRREGEKLTVTTGAIHKETYLGLLSRFSRVRLCATHRRQPTRFPHPWDFPGKSTGVGCHCLLLSGTKGAQRSHLSESGGFRARTHRHVRTGHPGEGERRERGILGDGRKQIYSSTNVCGTCFCIQCSRSYRDGLDPDTLTVHKPITRAEALSCRPNSQPGCFSPGQL